MLGQYGVGHWLAIKGTITHEDLERGFNLSQEVWHCSGIAHLWSRQFTRQNLVVFINRQMKLAPRSAGGDTVFLLVPLVFAVDPQSS